MPGTLRLAPPGHNGIICDRHLAVRIAVSAEIWPGLGTPMAVGKLVGRVVRYLDVGFALQYVQPRRWISSKS
ncbi:MAG TPA: hypothetical protein VF982_00890 [Anaerolineales bacterium]